MEPVSPISRGLNWQYLPKETSVERPSTGRYQNYPISSAVKLALSALEKTVERSSRCWEE